MKTVDAVDRYAYLHAEKKRIELEMEELKTGFVRAAERRWEKDGERETVVLDGTCVQVSIVPSTSPSVAENAVEVLRENLDDDDFLTAVKPDIAQAKRLVSVKRLDQEVLDEIVTNNPTVRVLVKTA